MTYFEILKRGIDMTIRAIHFLLHQVVIAPAILESWVPLSVRMRSIRGSLEGALEEEGAL
jgi:hypothetical protein